MEFYGKRSAFKIIFGKEMNGTFSDSNSHIVRDKDELSKLPENAKNFLESV